MYSADFYVVFRDSDQPRWWTRLLRRGFQHVYCLTELHPGVVLGVNPTHGGLEIGLMDGTAAGQAQAARLGGATVLKVTTEFPGFGKGKYLPGAFATCATVIAYHLALPIWAVTPWGLYKRLRKQYGAVPA